MTPPELLNGTGIFMVAILSLIIYGLWELNFRKVAPQLSTSFTQNPSVNSCHFRLNKVNLLRSDRYSLKCIKIYPMRLLDINETQYSKGQKEDSTKCMEKMPSASSEVGD